MEIELPDGTVLEAPDGADVKQVVRGYHTARLKAKSPEEYDPQSESFRSKYGPVQSGLREGIGSGMVRMDRGLGNVLIKTLNKLPSVRMLGGIGMPENTSDEALRTQDQLDEPLAQTGRGRVGQAIGQAAVGAAATAPLSALGGLGAGGNILTRTLAHPTTMAALEGAVTGAGASDPEHQMRGALTGAAASAAVERFLAGGGRALRGLAKKSEAVQDLEHEAGKTLDIPVSQAATDDDFTSRSIRAIYQEGLPNVMGVKGRVARQSKAALRDAQSSTNSNLADALIEEVFSEPVTRGGRTGRILTSIGLGGLAAYGNPMPALGILVGGNLAATRTVQRAIMGDTAAQKVVQDAIKKNPEVATEVQRFIEHSAAADAGNDNGGHD